MNKSSASPREQLQILKSGVVDLEVDAELLARLEKSHKTQKPLLIKAGFDPTAPDLHLGHAVLLTKMRQFQDLGHQVVFLIGDFTARIGDPTGKTAARPPLSDEEIKSNSATYEKQVFCILNKQKTTVRFNSQWLEPLNLADTIRLAAQYSLARLIERDDFKKRLTQGKPISVHELLYPLLQGYDSVALQADVELGGKDQLFNLLVGRDLMRSYGFSPQCVMTLPLLEGLSAKEENGLLIGDKMSKSLGNYVGLQEEPDTQFGKLMSISDALMWRYFALLSFKSQEEIEQLKKGHPKEAKVALALEIVARFHGNEAAQKAHAQFESLFGADKRAFIPPNAPAFKLATEDVNGISLMQALIQTHLISSNGEGKRLFRQGAISMNGQRLEEAAGIPRLKPGSYDIRLGKTKWAQITIALI